MQPKKFGVMVLVTMWLCATLACSAANNLFPDPASMESTAAAKLTQEEHTEPKATEEPAAGPTLKPGKKTPTPEPEIEVTLDVPGLNMGAVPTDIPLVEDKPANLFASNEVVAYQTEQDFAKVLAFYKAQMPENGWKKTDEITAGPTAILTYEKADRMAIVTCAEDSGLTSVSIIIQTK